MSDLNEKLDNLGKKIENRGEWQPREVDPFSEEGRREVFRMRDLERNRAAAIDRLSLQTEWKNDFSKVDTGEFRYLNPADLQSLIDKRDAGLSEIIRMREIEQERQRQRSRDRGR